MPKFFTARENISDHEIKIDNEDVAHITRVLRLKCGDLITVCDGRGYDYAARIERIEPKEIYCSVQSKQKCNTESNIAVTLFQGIPKASKMDYIIQKTTELGIVRIVPVALERCVVRLENKKAEEKKRDRWQKIAGEAAKQSGRGVIPEVTMPMSLEDTLQMAKQMDLCFVPYECEERKHLKEVLTAKPEVQTVGFMIGPEGGFDPVETEKIKAAGIETVTLGRRILRTETAGEAVLAMVMYELGDING